MNRPIRILDVGSGYGDGLRRVEQWARKRRINVELCGLDLNPDATTIAAKASPVESRIEWLTSDVLSYAPQQQPHLVMSSLFAHHLSDEEIVRFLRWMEQHSEVGWFINDLSREAVPYHFFRTASKSVGLHPFVQFDGPASILKAFVPADWQMLCEAAGLHVGDYVLQAFRPARLCVERNRPTIGQRPLGASGNRSS
jgi:2-polyprenyl-3-methyl-5-hydroxy-6-metoxy-1,4-benzoquinol methylase